MSDKLAIRTEVIPETYLLAQVVRSLPSPELFLRMLKTEIISLSSHELKDFGGNILKPADQARAELRVLKLINLGLEKASNIEGAAGGDHDFKMAQAILFNKPAALLYALGKKVFEQGKSKMITDLLKEAEIEIDGTWFRLISASELAAVKAMADLDNARGTLKEYRQAWALVIETDQKFRLLPLLPVNYFGLYRNKNWGSSKKGEYPIKHGIIDCFLLSLLIACMFRTKEELFSDREFLAQRNPWLKINPVDLNEMDIESIIGINRLIDRDRKERSNGTKFSQERQRNFLANILEVTIGEVKQFGDLIFFEPGKFAARVADIKERFFQYFIVVSSSLRIKVPRNLDSLISMALHSIAEKIQAEVKEFYSTVDNPDPSDVVVAIFWSQRVMISSRGYTERKERMAANKTLGAAAAERSLTMNDPAKLLTMLVEYIINATRQFVIWKPENKFSFCEHFNPTVFLRQENNSITLAKILKNLSPPSTTGWGKEILAGEKEKAAGVAVSDTTMPAIISDKDWVKFILDKVAWNLIHPSLIVELWQVGSDQVRDIMFSHRKNFKISVPSLKGSYIFDHRDGRLLIYVLEQLANQDKMSKEAWKEIIRLAGELPRAKMFIQLKYKEVTRNVLSTDSREPKV